MKILHTMTEEFILFPHSAIIHCSAVLHFAADSTKHSHSCREVSYKVINHSSVKS